MTLAVNRPDVSRLINILYLRGSYRDLEFLYTDCVFNTRGHVKCLTLDFSNCFISGQSTYNRLKHVY